MSLSIADRVATGRAARRKVARRDHAKFRPTVRRASVVEILAAQAATRVPELVPIRHGRMLASPFAFFRGAAAIMAPDLATTPRSGLTVQLCGDAHLTNFGVFAAPDRRLVFDLNDFDETAPGPWEWDLKRLVASFEVAMREREFHGAMRQDVVRAAVAGYRHTMLEFAKSGMLDVWYARLDADTLLRDFADHARACDTKRVARGLVKARSRDRLHALTKLTTNVDGAVRFAMRPPLLVPLDQLVKSTELRRLRALLESVLQTYSESLPPDRRRLLDQYRLVEFARKVVGVGSVGTRAFVALLVGATDADPLFLQFKEAECSVLEPFAGKSEYPNHGRRVVEGQRLMQAAGDILLGWCRVPGFDKRSHDYYVRQLWDGKGSPDPAVAVPGLFAPYARACGWALARAHARSGDRIALAAYLGKSDAFDDALCAFARTYADQNERDFDALKAAVKRGDLAAETGV